MAGFNISGRLTDTTGVTKPYWCSLLNRPRGLHNFRFLLLRRAFFNLNG
jgi:hypothetical protein